MNSFDRAKLNHLQVGRYAEYLVKMEMVEQHRLDGAADRGRPGHRLRSALTPASHRPSYNSPAGGPKGNGGGGLPSKTGNPSGGGRYNAPSAGGKGK